MVGDIIRFVEVYENVFVSLLRVVAVIDHAEFGKVLRCEHDDKSSDELIEFPAADVQHGVYVSRDAIEVD
jgi:hypothetical protein